MPNALTRPTATGLTFENAAHQQGLHEFPSLKPEHMVTSDSVQRPSGYKSKYRGVSKSNADKWRVRVHLNGRQIHVGRYKDEVTAARAFDNVLLHISEDAAHFNFGREAAMANRTPLDPRILKALQEYSALGPKQSLTSALPTGSCVSSPSEGTAPAPSSPFQEPICPHSPILPLPLASMPVAYLPSSAPAAYMTSAKSMPLPSIISAAGGVTHRDHQQQQACQGLHATAVNSRLSASVRSARKRARVGPAEGDEQQQQQQEEMLRRSASAPSLHVPGNHPSSPGAGAAAAGFSAPAEPHSVVGGLEQEVADGYICANLQASSMKTSATINSSSHGASGKLSLVVGGADVAVPVPAQSLSVGALVSLEGPVTPDAAFIPMACQRGSQVSQEPPCQHSSRQQLAQQMQQQQLSGERPPSSSSAAATAVAASAALLGDSLLGSGGPELHGDLEQLLELIKQLAVHEAHGGGNCTVSGDREPPMLLGAAMQLIMAKIASIKAMRQVNECLSQARLAHDKVVAAELELVMKLQQQQQQQVQQPPQQQKLMAAAELTAAPAPAGFSMSDAPVSGPPPSAPLAVAWPCSQQLDGAAEAADLPEHEMELDMDIQPAGGGVSSNPTEQQAQQRGFASMLIAGQHPHSAAAAAACGGAGGGGGSPGDALSPDVAAAAAQGPTAVAGAACDHTPVPAPGTSAAAAAALAGSALHVPLTEVLTSSPLVHDGELDAFGSGGEDWWLTQLQRLPSFGIQDPHHLQNLLKSPCASEPMVLEPIGEGGMLGLLGMAFD